MPTLEALETAVNDYKRAQTSLADLLNRRDGLQAQLNVIEGALSSANAAFRANEDTLRTVSAQFARSAR